MTSLTLFDIVKNINETSEDKWIEFQYIYNPYIINRFIAMNSETIGFASIMNKLYFLPKKMQYYFYLYGIPNKKRYSKYVLKVEKNEDIDFLSKHYNVNKLVAKQYLKILTKEQLKEIYSIYDKGGLIK